VLLCRGSRDGRHVSHKRSTARRVGFAVAVSALIDLPTSTTAGCDRGSKSIPVQRVFQSHDVHLTRFSLLECVVQRNLVADAAFLAVAVRRICRGIVRHAGNGDSNWTICHLLAMNL
jgi:hypothetical protein